jgi:membrane fusion protein (multidrug efflux system)
VLTAHAEAINPSVAAAVAKPADEDITSSGPIVVENQLDVASEREGVVAEISADTGKSVRKGDLLARLDDRQLSADRDAAEAKLHSIEADVRNWIAEVKVLEADLDRSEKMWAAQIITQEQLDHDRFKVEADRYELERARQTAINQQDVIRSLNLELEKTHVLAPFDGVVARRYVRVGQRVGSGDRLFWVTAIAPLRVKFTLPEQFMSRVVRGQSINVVSPDSPNTQHSAKVIQISPVVDPSSGTIEVLAEIVGPGGDLRPGMTANVRIPQPR